MEHSGNNAVVLRFVEIGEIFFRFLQVGGVRSLEILVIRLVKGVSAHGTERVFHLACFLGLAKLEDHRTLFAIAQVLVDPEFRGNEIAVFEELFGMDVRYFENKVEFVQKIRFTEPDYAIDAFLEYGACSDQTCLPPQECAIVKSGKSPVAAEEADEKTSEEQAATADTTAQESAADSLKADTIVVVDDSQDIYAPVEWLGANMISYTVLGFLVGQLEERFLTLNMPAKVGVLGFGFFLCDMLYFFLTGLEKDVVTNLFFSKTLPECAYTMVVGAVVFHLSIGKKRKHV